MAPERRRLPALGPHGGPRRAAPRVVPVRPREGARQGATALPHEAAAPAAGRHDDGPIIFDSSAGEKKSSISLVIYTEIG